MIRRSERKPMFVRTVTPGDTRPRRDTTPARHDPGLEDSPGALLPSPSGLITRGWSPEGDRIKAPGESSSPGTRGRGTSFLRRKVRDVEAPVRMHSVAGVQL